MLKEWLQVDTTASWEKLFTVIESPAVMPYSALDKGNYMHCVCHVVVLVFCIVFTKL